MMALCMYVPFGSSCIMCINTGKQDYNGKATSPANAVNLSEKYLVFKYMWGAGYSRNCHLINSCKKNNNMIRKLKNVKIFVHINKQITVNRISPMSKLFTFHMPKIHQNYNGVV